MHFDLWTAKVVDNLMVSNQAEDHDQIAAIMAHAMMKLTTHLALGEIGMEVYSGNVRRWFQAAGW